jgi:hypothetical protein
MAIVLAHGHSNWHSLVLPFIYAFWRAFFKSLSIAICVPFIVAKRYTFCITIRESNCFTIRISEHSAQLLS